MPTASARATALLLAAVAAVAATGCGSGSTSSASPRPRPVAKPGPVAPTLAVRLEGQPQGAASAGTGVIHAKAGSSVALQLRIRNAGQDQTGDVRTRMLLPRGVTVAMDTVQERDVGTNALGRPLDSPEQLFAGGTLLAPFLGGASASIELTVLIPKHARGDLRAVGSASAPGTAGRSALTIRLG